MSQATITSADQMGRLIRATLICTLLSAHTGDAQAQVRPDTLGVGIAWRLTAEAGPQRVVGVVLSIAGHPVPGALVMVGAPGLAALSDSSGGFDVRIPQSGEWRIEVNRIGHSSAVSTLTIPPGFSAFVAAILPEAEIPMCGLRVRTGNFGPDDLNITVLDAVTDEMPEGDVTLRLWHGDSLWERTYTLGTPPATAGTIGIGRAITSLGRHSIEVEVAGYVPWRLEDVELWLIDDGCSPVLSNSEHVARLVRRSR